MSKGCILVAGGAGYIGQHFCMVAHEAGYKPIALDVKGHATQYAPLERADIGDSAAVRDVICRHNPIAAVSFATLPDGPAHNDNAEAYWQNNFIKTAGFFKTLDDAGVRNFVYASTAAVYGMPAHGNPVDEKEPLNPTSVSGMTQLACEVLLHGMGQRQDSSDIFTDAFIRHVMKVDMVYPEFKNPMFPNLNTIILRSFQVAGGDGGRVLSLADAGHDYTHVLDVARAHLLALEYLLHHEGVHELINIGSGIGAPPALVANNNKARALLNWAPTRDLLSNMRDTKDGLCESSVRA